MQPYCAADILLLLPVHEASALLDAPTVGVQRTFTAKGNPLPVSHYLNVQKLLRFTIISTTLWKGVRSADIPLRPGMPTRRHGQNQLQEKNIFLPKEEKIEYKGDKVN